MSMDVISIFVSCAEINEWSGSARGRGSRNRIRTWVSGGNRYVVLIEDSAGHVFLQGFGDGVTQIIPLPLLLVVFPREGNELPEFPVHHLDAADHKLIIQHHADESLERTVLLLVLDRVDVDFS